jgi:acetyltransferase-like isoleucine patch superfamily enzyme
MNKMSIPEAEQLKTHKAVTEGGSALSRYQNVVVGSTSIRFLIYYEFCLILAHIPGAAGLFLRKIFWPRLFGKCGKGVVFAENIVIRHPKRIYLGNRVVVSEGCILDARNTKEYAVINIEYNVIFSKNVMVSCKNGAIRIGSRSGVGAQTIIQSTHGNPVNIGSDTIIGPRCYIVGGGSYHTERFDIPIWKQGIKYDGGVILEDNVWLGANVTVLGGVTMGSGSIAAAGSVVTKPIPNRAICSGVPAATVRLRDDI